MGNYGDNDNDGFDLSAAAAVIALVAAVPTAVKAINEVLQDEISLPNIPFPVAKWGMWDTISECDGWRLEQNIVTKHCRIVDPEGVRRAWGTKNGMIKALEEVNNRFSKS